MSFKDKVVDKILGLADKIASFPSLKRLKYELILLGYMVLASLLVSIVSFVFGDWIQGTIFSVVFASSCFMFINRSVMYKKVKFLNNFKQGLAIDKIQEAQNVRREPAQ